MRKVEERLRFVLMWENVRGDGAFSLCFVAMRDRRHRVQGVT